VHGRVVDIRPQIAGDRRTIETVVTLAVLDAIKGQPGATVYFRVPGGQIGRYRRFMVGAPEFASGDEVVLFLKGRPPVVPFPFGLNQGVYRVVRDGDWKLQLLDLPHVAQRAREFIASGNYFWNSGMFLFGATRFLDELKLHAPDIAEVCARASAAAVREKDFTRVDEATFAACRSDSIDYAVMEKTRDAVMVPLDAGWNDVGSWAALHDVLPADAQGNVIRGDVLLEDSNRSAEAAGIYRAALEVSPGMADAHYNLALLCERKGLRREALRHLSAYRKING